MTAGAGSRPRAVLAACAVLALTSLLPPPTYEMPNNLLFEITGILQVLPAAIAARALWRTP